LAKCRPNDAVIGNFWVETIFDEAVALDAVDFNVDRSRIGVGGKGNGLVDGATRTTTEIFNGAQCSSCRTTNIIHACFQSIKFLYDCEWNDNFATRK
jgi:hypothetical protein